MQTANQCVAVTGLFARGRPGGEGLLLYVIVSVETIHVAGDTILTLIDCANSQVEEVPYHASVRGYRVERARELDGLDTLETRGNFVHLLLDGRGCTEEVV
jgi:hypothetical protein